MGKRYLGLLAAALGIVGLASSAFGQAADDYRQRINRGTVGVISGGIDGTYIRFATDLAAVLDGEDTRVLAIMGKGSVQNIDDILYLKGIDIGIVQSDVFQFVKRANKHPTIDDRIHYITKLYNEEFHLLARREIKSIQDLAGKRVSFGVAGSGTAMTAGIVFDTLGIRATPVSMGATDGLEALKNGQVDAMVYVAGKPTRLFNSVTAADNLHFLTVPATKELLGTYLPSKLGQADYPQLVAEGQDVKTVAVGAVMAVYNWQPGTARHTKVSRFIEAFFSNFDSFKRAPRHPKWQEVSLTAVVPGWNRFKPAEDWLLRSATADSGEIKEAFDTFLAKQAPSLANRLTSQEDKEELFKLFMLWQASQP